MDLGLVIVNWNVRDLLTACLDSIYLDLAQNAGELAATVCVVDNGSTDDSAAMVRRQFPRTALIETDNRGMGAGNNLGIQFLLERDAPFAVLILNPDTLIRPGALLRLTRFLRDHPRAGVAAPKLLNPNGTLQHAGFHFPGLIQNTLDLFPLPGRLARFQDSPLNGRYPARWYASGQPFPVDHTLGAAFAVRSETIAACGGFDETFTMYCEEIDWQWRMARAGWERWVVPGAEIIHYGGQSTGQVRAQSLIHLWTSRKRLHRRYHPPLFNAVLSQIVQWGLRQKIRDNHRRSQRGELSVAQRAELHQALTEIIQVWGRGRANIQAPAPKSLEDA